jgi:hypothetical protein
VGKVSDIVKTPFGFLFARSRKEDLVAEHVIREHRRGRNLTEILQDAYVTNRLPPEKVQRVLERPDVVHAIGEDLVAAHRAVNGSV